MQYAAHLDFIAPAGARPALWRLALGLVLCLLVYVAAIAVIGVIAMATTGFQDAALWMERMAQADTPTATLLVLATFIGMGLGPMLAARLLHKRPVGTLFGPRTAMIRHFTIAMLVCAGIYGLTALIPSGLDPAPNLAPALWASLLPLALVAILIQTGAEEVLFRGYIQQQMAARFSSPFAWMVLPSALFAVLHYQPAIMGQNAWVVVAVVFLFAVLAADLTARTGNIGAAWGFHFANNCVAILFVAMDGPLSGLALYTLPMGTIDPAALRPMLMLDMLVTLGVYAAIRWAVTRN